MTPALSQADIALAILGLIGLLIVGAMVSSAEVAFLSYNFREGQDMDDDSEKNSIIQELLDRPKHLLITILLVNTLCTVGLVIVGNYILTAWISPQWYHDVSQTIINLFQLSSSVDAFANGFALLLHTVILTFFIVIFGDSIPKLYASNHHKAVMGPTASMLTFFSYMLSPMSNTLVSLSNMIERKSSHNQQKIQQRSKEDIDTAIELTMTTQNESSIQEADILKGIVNFSEISVKQILQPRLEMVTLDDVMGFREVMRIVKEFSYSRLPVYHGDLDRIVGIIYVKDLLAFLNEDDLFDWQHLIRKTVLFVPASKKIDELLREFQKQRAHLAVIVDEYGGTAGIVTLEDIMEEVVGEIKDEFDKDEETSFMKLSDNSYIFEGKATIKDVCKIIGVNPTYFDHHRREADSLAGLILEIVGQIPNSDFEIRISEFVLKVVTVSKRRIEKISLIKNESK